MRCLHITAHTLRAPPSSVGFLARDFLLLSPMKISMKQWQQHHQQKQQQKPAEATSRSISHTHRIIEYNQKREQSDARTWSWLHDAQMEVEVTKSDLGKKSQQAK